MHKKLSLNRNVNRLLICVCISLCTTVVHNTAQDSSDNFPSCPPGNHHSLDDVHWRWYVLNGTLTGARSPTHSQQNSTPKNWRTDKSGILRVNSINCTGTPGTGVAQSAYKELRLLLSGVWRPMKNRRSPANGALLQCFQTDGCVAGRTSGP